MTAFSGAPLAYGLGGLDMYPGMPLMQPGMQSGGIGGGGGSRSSKAAKNHRKDDDDYHDPVYTTVMLRNIPNKYTRQMLIDQLHKAGFKGDVDYMYLPTDFANHCNVGYCFVNMRTAQARQRFLQSFDGVAAQTCLPGFNSYKVCQVTRAKWQGRDENVRRLSSGPELMAQLAAHPEWLPLLLDEAGEQEPFDCSEFLTGSALQAGGAGRGGGAAALGSRRQGAKKKGTGLAEESLFTNDLGLGCGKGEGKKAVGRGGRKGQHGGRPGRYPDAYFSAEGAPVMGMPVMTERGLQYLPYDPDMLFDNSLAAGAYLAAAGYSGMGQAGGMYGGNLYGNHPGWWGSIDAEAAEGFGIDFSQYPAMPQRHPRQQKGGDSSGGGDAPMYISSLGLPQDEDDEEDDGLLVRR